MLKLIIRYDTFNIITLHVHITLVNLYQENKDTFLEVSTKP